MSMSGDTADKLVQEGIQITESAMKLAGLGAKHLAAFLIALLKDSEKLKGKANINLLLKTGKPLSNFYVKKEDFVKFKNAASKEGILFTPLRNVSGKNKDVFTIVAKSEDAPRINNLMEELGLKLLKIEDNVKNAPSRVQPEGKLSERRRGLMQTAIERMASPMTQKDRLESLGAETLAALVLDIAAQNRDLQSKNPLAALFDQGKDMQIVTVHSKDVASIKKQMEAANIPVQFSPKDDVPNRTNMVARTNDAQLINHVFESNGLIAPMKLAPAKAKETTADRSSVKVKLSAAKSEASKAAPVRAKSRGSKLKPKMPER